MSQFIVNCPGCSTPLQCEEAWAGQQIQCPSCQTALMVPGSAAPPPPAAGVSRPSAQKGKGAAFAGKRKVKKGVNAKKALMISAVVVLVAAGGYFGFNYWQAKMNAEGDNGAGGGQVAANAASTDPNNASPAPAPGNPGEAAGQMQPDGGQGGAMPTNNLPVLPPTFTLDVGLAKILESKANGRISRTNFVVETARLDPGTTSHALRLRQGNSNSPDVEVVVYLRLKSGESPAGKTWTVTKDERSKDVASVSKLWKSNPRYAATRKDFFTGYVLKLELAAASEGILRGRIYLALPDAEQSVVGGVFYAESPAVAGATQPTIAAPEGAAPADAPVRFRPPQP